MEETAWLRAPGNFSRKVVSIAAGEAHTLALTEDGCVYTWGRGIFGRLGTGSESDEPRPVRVNFDFPGEKQKVIGVAAGAYHNLALAEDGSVWCWGYNIYDQLGFSGENSAVPRLMATLLKSVSAASPTDEPRTESQTPLKPCSVKAGGMMSFVIDNLGSLWMFGNIPQESSEPEHSFTLLSTFTPTPVGDFHGHTVVKVTCGNEHVVALVSAGETYQGEDLLCYSWGCNSHGQLGLGDRESRIRPQVIEMFNQDAPWTVYEIACGAFHTALLTHKKGLHDGLESTCWTFGRGDNGQLGHGTTQSFSVPEPVKELPRPVYLVSLDCGLFHTSVVSSGGDVWSWGMEKGLGLCPEASYAGSDPGDAVVPLRVNGSTKFPNPIQIVCGAAHTVVLTHDGYKIWSWGRGRNGVLGNSSWVDSYAPSPVLWPPSEEDFEQNEAKPVDNDAKDGGAATSKQTVSHKKLASAMEEIRILQLKLGMMERYAAILHGAMFGKPLEEDDIPVSLTESGFFDVGREWKSMLDSADQSRLMKLERFYRSLLRDVKDKRMTMRVREIVEGCLRSASATGS